MMRNLFIVLYLTFASQTLLCQSTDYESKLAQYMAEFKSNASSDQNRMDIFDKTESLKNQIDIQINLNNSYDDEYRSLSSTKKKIKAFYNYISCLSKYSNTEFPKEEFDYVNEVLAIYPYEVPGLTCKHATSYEITIGKFKATFVYNILKQTDYFDYKMIEIEYDCLINGEPFQKGSLNLAGNNIQVMEYLGDKGNNYYKIVNLRCKEAK